MRIWKALTIIFIGFYAAIAFINFKANASPHLANYYLGVLPTDADSIKKLARTDLLILSPDQFITRSSVLSDIRKVNPDIIMLAYVPSQSYNLKYWKDDLVFRNMTGIKDSWWLRDKNGNPVSSWPGLMDMNMDKEWSDYLVQFVNNNILSLQNVDGIFFDIVNEGITHVNGGNVVLGNIGGTNVSNGALNSEWVERMKYLLHTAHTNLKTKYIVINGSSHEAYQAHVNGRMYETFPTPWESNGSWSAIMTRLEKIKTMNLQPKLYIFNSNTNNTGKKDDYQKVRFGVASSMMTDNVYFSYDYGDENHQQIWWYDEFDANLGTPVGQAVSQKGVQLFGEDVWKRDYSKGLAIVNPTNQAQTVELGGEYEKLSGTQDRKVNDGSIVEKVKLQPKDGILLYKTLQTVENILYPNGSFLRFYNLDGSRARNGFFSFESDLQGGAKVYRGDLNGDFSIEKIIVTGPKIEIFNSDGQSWFSDTPFGNYKGELNIAIVNVNRSKEKNIIVGGTSGGKVMVYDYHGGIIKSDIYPLGKKYKGILTPTVASFGKESSIVFATNNEVVVFDSEIKKIIKRFYPFGKTFPGPLSIAAGDFNGNGVEELVVGGIKQKKPVIGVFSGAGSKIADLQVKGLVSSQKISLEAADILGRGRDEIIVMSKN